MFGKDVADDRHRHAPHDAAEGAGGHAGSQQHRVAIGHGAQQGAQQKAGVQDHERGPPGEAIDHAGGQNSGHAGGEGVAGDDQAKLGRLDLQGPHQLRPQRHHDHEIDDRDELHRGQNHQHDPLVPPLRVKAIVRFALPALHALVLLRWCRIHRREL